MTWEYAGFYACSSGLRGSVMRVRDSGDHPPKEQFADVGCVEQTFSRVAAEESDVRQSEVNETLGKTAHPEQQRFRSALRVR